MNKIGVLLIILIFIPFISSASIEMNSEYKKGETIIAKVSGNFVNPIQEENVFFYRGHVKIPMNYDVAKIGDVFYVVASTIGKTENNYSLQIQGVQYYEAGQVVDNDIIKNFSIVNETADFSISPAFIVTSQDFSIELQSLLDVSLNVDIENFNKTNSIDSTTVSAQQIKTIDFQVIKSNQTVFGIITMSSQNTEYKIPIEIFPVPGTEAFCGNGVIDSGEECDGNNLGNTTGCDDFGFNSGIISCNPSGTTNECTFDKNNCFDEFIEECLYDFECNDDEECVDNKCVEEVECSRESGCDDDEDCVNNKCVPEDRECIEDNDCDSGEDCVRWECVPEDNSVCQRNSDCKNSSLECVSDKCVEKISPEVRKTCSDLGGGICGANEECNGDSQKVGNSICCLGFCEDKGGSSNSKIIGWAILISIGCFLVFFYIKYRRAKRKTPDLAKIGGLKR